VIGVQTLFKVITLCIFAAALWYQQHELRKLLAEQYEAYTQGYRFVPYSWNPEINDIVQMAFFPTLGVMIVLALMFGYLSARYALRPTRNSLDYQKRFIGNLAHELRTPLSIIRTNTEVALMDPSLDGYAQSTFRTTIEELDRISSIINNLLSLDALTRPGHIRFTPIDLREVATSVVERHKDMAQHYGINIGLDAAEEPTYVMGNKSALDQALTNLTKNALNYTPQHDNRNVVVRVDNNEDTVSASVIDTGIGIAQDDLYNVFLPYYRGDTSRERGIGSGTSGLGLAIVNDIVRVHNGSITIRSALNRGTTIEIVFPKAKVGDFDRIEPESTEDGAYVEKISA
jgi:signal transduction histidine kinase